MRETRRRSQTRELCRVRARIDPGYFLRENLVRLEKLNQQNKKTAAHEAATSTYPHSLISICPSPQTSSDWEQCAAEADVHSAHTVTANRCFR